MKLRHSARTDVGKTRDHNEDSYGIGEGEQAEQMGELLVVCDGMGGHAAGEVASQLAVQAILTNYYGDSADDRPRALSQAFEQANADVYEHGHGSMGTTGVAALFLHDAVHIANVGDSRAYLVRDGAIRQLSRDHSFVGDQVAAGLITADQARVSPHRNVITRALGYQSEVVVDLFPPWPLQVGDAIVLSSDGMHGLVTDAEITQTVATQTPEAAAQQLIDLANNRGGTDNITVVVARVEELDWIGAPVGDVHDRTTVELPEREVEIIESPAALAASDVVEPPAPLEATPQPAAPPAPLPAAEPPAAPPERRFSRLGGILALALALALAGVIAFALYPTPVLAPTDSATPATTSAATSAPTSAATSAATAAATTAPTTAATSAATAAATTGPTTAATVAATPRVTATP